MKHNKNANKTIEFDTKNNLICLSCKKNLSQILKQISHFSIQTINTFLQLKFESDFSPIFLQNAFHPPKSSKSDPSKQLLLKAQSNFDLSLQKVKKKKTKTQKKKRMVKIALNHGFLPKS